MLPPWLLDLGRHQRLQAVDGRQTPQRHRATLTVTARSNWFTATKRQFISRPVGELSALIFVMFQTGTAAKVRARSSTVVA
jgi:hypothetical protein